MIGITDSGVAGVTRPPHAMFQHSATPNCRHERDFFHRYDLATGNEVSGPGDEDNAMLGGAAQMDRIGFASKDFFVSIMIKNMSELKENRWIWIR